MSTGAPTVHVDDKGLTIERTYKTTPERLYRAWTDPALACQWLSPGPVKCALPVYDARPGGRFQIEMTSAGPDGRAQTWTMEGTFDELVPPERVVMTWIDESGPTRVSATFTRVEGGTRMRLTHTGLPGLAWSKGAAAGWESGMEKLAKLV